MEPSVEGILSCFQWFCTSELVNKMTVMSMTKKNNNNNNNKKKKKKKKKKQLKNPLLRNQESFEAESWYIAYGTQGLPSLFTWWS